ncbi:MAG: GGDEF domain-containing protein [Chloroflexi bacterium]|nr:GGDEF domain-containing protein [Chloroflexota bacterium]
MPGFIQMLDLRTIIFFLGFTAILQSATIALLSIFVHKYQGVRTAMMGNVMLAGGMILIAYREELSAFVSIVLANTILLSGMALIHIAICRFSDQDYNRLLVGGVLIIGTSSLFHYTYADENLPARIVVTSLLQISLLLATILKLSRIQTRTYRASADLITFVFLAHCFLLAVRATVVVFFPPQSMSDLSALQAAFYFFTFITSYSWTTGYILMISQRLYGDLNEMATIDWLTRLINRRAMIRQIESELGRKQRGLGNFSILLIDIDHFKAINDRFGHNVGDYVLHDVSRTFESAVRLADIVSRWGGEEFLILLPQTHIQEALITGERLRAHVEETVYGRWSVAVRITVSVGVAGSCHGSTLEDIYESVDRALYEAKKTRNTVALYKAAKEPILVE